MMDPFKNGCWGAKAGLQKQVYTKGSKYTLAQILKARWQGYKMKEN